MKGRGFKKKLTKERRQTLEGFFFLLFFLFGWSLSSWLRPQLLQLQEQRCCCWSASGLNSNRVPPSRPHQFWHFAQCRYQSLYPYIIWGDALAFTTFLTLSSVISCFNLCSSKSAYTYSMEKASTQDHI